MSNNDKMEVSDDKLSASNENAPYIYSSIFVKAKRVFSLGKYLECVRANLSNLPHQVK
jgi:hypothetical protein